MEEDKKPDLTEHCNIKVVSQVLVQLSRPYNAFDLASTCCMSPEAFRVGMQDGNTVQFKIK